MIAKDTITLFMAVVLLAAIGCQKAKPPPATIIAEHPTNAAIEPVMAVTHPDGDRKNTEAEKTHTVIAYYFHGAYRCPSCLKIETLSSQTIESGFARAIEDGRLQWVVVNVDKPGNEDFIEDYQLDTSTLVLVDTHNGKKVRWKKLNKVWKLVNQSDSLVQYVQDEVSDYLRVD